MSHFYTHDCEPRHTVIGKNGKERKSTIRDCRANGWLPSVSTILDVIAKPQLDTWKFRQIADACYHANDAENKMFVEEYSAKMIEKAFDKVKDAADIGTQVHDALDRFFTGQEYNPNEVVEIDGKKYDMHTFVSPVAKWVDENKVEFEANELRLTNIESGYAGTTDAAVNLPESHGIMDFKTRKTKEGEKIKPYETEVMQIAAYHMAHYGHITTNSVGWNVYISTTEPGRIHAHAYDYKELGAAYEAFSNACGLWRWIKNYDPRGK
jgi:hypothetical protein